LKIRGWHDLLAGTAFIVFGAAALILLRHLPAGNLAAMGSAAFPNLCAAILIAMGLLLVARSFAVAMQRRPVIAWRPMLVVSLSIGLFALLVLRIGLRAAATIMVVVAGFASYESPPRVRQFVVLGLVLAASAAALFSWALGLPLPILPR
jgi:hypothetical protein